MEVVKMVVSILLLLLAVIAASNSGIQMQKAREEKSDRLRAAMTGVSLFAAGMLLAYVAMLMAGGIR